MSDDQKPDSRYAEWWESPLVFLLAATMLIVMTFQYRSELRDLQLRVGQLEQQIKQP